MRGFSSEGVFMPEILSKREQNLWLSLSDAAVMLELLG